jgi:hypothetical protein
MADVKISGLPASTTPLAGTEVVPIVQSGVTKQVSIANLTAGRQISASSITDTGLTSGRIPYAGSGGLIQDSANLLFDGTNLAVSGAVSGTSITDSGLTSGRIPYAGTGGLLQDSTNLLFDGTNLTVSGKIKQVSGSSVPYTLFSTGIPFIIVSSGSMGNNGALTITGAVASIYPNAYVYLPSGAISSGSAAGYYYAIFSSTTAATVYNNTYTPGSGVPTVPASPTAFSTTGPGAYTQSASPPNPFSVVVPANALSINGKIEIDAFSTQTSGSSFMALFVGSLYTQSNSNYLFQSTKWKASARGVTNGLCLGMDYTNATYNSYVGYGTDSIASTITIALSLKSLTPASVSVAVESFIIKVYP